MFFNSSFSTRIICSVGFQKTFLKLRFSSDFCYFLLLSTIHRKSSQIPIKKTFKLIVVGFQRFCDTLLKFLKKFFQKHLVVS